MPMPNLDFLHAPASVWVTVLFLACTALTAILLARVVQWTGVGMNRFWPVLALLLNVVTLALLSAPTPAQQLAF